MLIVHALWKPMCLPDIRGPCYSLEALEKLLLLQRLEVVMLALGRLLDRSPSLCPQRREVEATKP